MIQGWLQEDKIGRKMEKKQSWLSSASLTSGTHKRSHFTCIWLNLILCPVQIELNAMASAPRQRLFPFPCCNWPDPSGSPSNVSLSLRLFARKMAHNVTSRAVLSVTSDIVTRVHRCQGEWRCGRKMMAQNDETGTP